METIISIIIVLDISTSIYFSNSPKAQSTLVCSLLTSMHRLRNCQRVCWALILSHKVKKENSRCPFSLQCNLPLRSCLCSTWSWLWGAWLSFWDCLRKLPYQVSTFVLVPSRKVFSLLCLWFQGYSSLTESREEITLWDATKVSEEHTPHPFHR